MIERIKSHPEVLWMLGVLLLMFPYAISLIRNQVPARWVLLLFWFGAALFAIAPVIAIVFLAIQVYRG